MKLSLELHLPFKLPLKEDQKFLSSYYYGDLSCSFTPYRKKVKIRLMILMFMQEIADKLGEKGLLNSKNKVDLNSFQIIQVIHIIMND